MTEKCQQLHIAGAAASYDVVTNSVNLVGVALVCTNAGLSFAVTNREATPKFVLDINPTAAGWPIEYYAGKPLPMTGGIKIVVTGTPTIDVWVWFQTP
jgi:hypothetical protein